MVYEHVCFPGTGVLLIFFPPLPIPQLVVITSIYKSLIYFQVLDIFSYGFLLLNYPFVYPAHFSNTSLFLIV